MTTNKQLRECREEVFIMVSKGMHQKEMAEKLNVTKSTISYDVKSIMENSDRKLTDLVNKMLPSMYEKCINGINEVLRETWNIYASEREENKGYCYFLRNNNSRCNCGNTTFVTKAVTILINQMFQVKFFTDIQFWFTLSRTTF